MQSEQRRFLQVSPLIPDHLVSLLPSIPPPQHRNPNLGLTDPKGSRLPPGCPLEPKSQSPLIQKDWCASTERGVEVTKQRAQSLDGKQESPAHAQLAGILGLPLFMFCMRSLGNNESELRLLLWNPHLTPPGTEVWRKESSCRRLTGPLTGQVRTRTQGAYLWPDSARILASTYRRALTTNTPSSSEPAEPSHCSLKVQEQTPATCLCGCS